MKKYFKYYAISWAIALVAFNVIIFVITSATMGLSALLPSFWVGYGFITLAFIGNLICSLLFFKEDNKGKVFLNVSVINLAYTALVVSLIVGIVAMVVPSIPYWVGIIVDVLVLAFYAIAIIKASAAVNIVSDIDKKVKQQTFFIKSLTVDADSLQASAKTDEAKALAKKVYEAIRYSDPMSNPQLESIEFEMQNKFNEFEFLITKSDTDNAKLLADELLVLVDNRNKKCKLLK